MPPQASGHQLSCAAPLLPDIDTRLSAAAVAFCSCAGQLNNDRCADEQDGYEYIMKLHM